VESHIDEDKNVARWAAGVSDTDTEDSVTHEMGRLNVGRDSDEGRHTRQLPPPVRTIAAA